MDASIFNLSPVAQKAAPDANTTFYHKLLAVMDGRTKQLTNEEISRVITVIENGARDAKRHLQAIQKKQRGAEEAVGA